MYKRIGLVLLAALLFSGSSCPPEQVGGSNPDNTLVPRNWSQVNSDKENSGFNAVHTVQAYSATRKWTVPVGPLAFAAPVIGPDGVIYVGTANGELVAIDPNGTERWRRKLAASILSTPAVNAATNEIFVLAQDAAPAGTISSKLYRLNSVAGLHSVSSISMASSAAPKLWGDFVFVSSGTGRLWVFDQLSLTEVGHTDATSCFNLVCGSGAGWSQAVIDFLACVVDPTACPSPPLAPPPGPLVEPSVAIVDAATLVQDPARPTIVVIGPQCASGYRFHPAGDAPAVVPPIDSHFELLWSRALVAVDCDVQADATRRSTTPAAILGGLVVFNSTSQVTFPPLYALDVQTGSVVWTSFPSRVMQNAVASALRPIYAATETQLEIRDSNGRITNILPLQGKGHAVAVSQDWVYVTTDQGVHSFTLDGNLVAYFDSTLRTGVGNGMSFPVIGADGVVYVTTPDGYLRAYATTTQPPPLIIAANFPAVTWQTPTNNANLSYAAGQSLVVNLTGAGNSPFSGNVSFASDVDGTLCDAIPAGATATCVTTQPLTVGPHSLTAVAIDDTGASFNAAISVEVTNTAPTVSISSPATASVFQEGTPITFAASVTDPDQAIFPADQVLWQSNVDGEIGTGLTFTRTLSLGAHTITAIATDEKGATGQATVEIQVTSPSPTNTPPTVTIQQPANDSILFSGTPITFVATVSDPEEPTFPNERVTWRSSVDGDLGTGTTVAHALTNGSHVITVTATDAQGVAAEASVNVTVQAPVQ